MKKQFLNKKKAGIFLMIIMMISAGVFFQSCGDDEIKPGDAAIISFKIGEIQGTIDEGAKTINAELLAGTDVTALTPTIVISQGATISPASGASVNFTNPVEYTVTDVSGTVINTYTVTITSAELRKMAFIGNAAENTQSGWDACKGTNYDLMDDRTAAEWFKTAMASGVNELTYLSFYDVAGGADLSKFHTIWIQYDGGTWGGVVSSFPNNGEDKHCLLGEEGVTWDVTCDDVVNRFVLAVKNYYNAGGNILLGNYAGSIVDEIGVVSKSDYAPNNSWGGLSVDAGATNEAWMARWAGPPTSPLFANIIIGTDINIPPPAFIMIEAGGEKKNRSNQYNLNWGPWAPNGDADPLTIRRAAFENLTGGKILIENGGRNEVQMVKWPAKDNKGTVIAIIGGTYDWYIGALSGADRNMKTLTKNSLNYLVDLAMKE